ncbi:Gfo/Idh/MocA family oxidoreductase [Ktedonosporobacter rubrisoli]|uniref:Gfo/Idh/MocA family oxidoreductase n=1 Tax=Ktedonosporobacter rubrisoli TaxID=2509675 RepID=A0A4P6K3H3_KTERU|nr:Gfo/Idh/MocA family oxidoreductase [Ktedonosporobacter rubrisoli]QBD82512.1 Gfo/Idh/MocA family oxidoreductase [Ktedonosporobacter rubrisoli]
MTKQYRFGIIGGGVIGQLHAQAITSLPEAQLVAVVDIIPERAQKLAEMYHVRPYNDIQEMLKREQLDIVTVCTPSGQHGEHACQVMRSGRHVVVEKPMEIKRTAIEEMLHVQNETGVKLAVISQHRFDPASRQVYDLVQEQALGKLVLGNAIIPWWRSQAYYDSGAWRGTWELDGGGVLMNQSIHSIDLLQWFMGPVKSIVAYTDTLAHRMETEDAAVAILRFANGALGTISATTGAYPGNSTRIEVYGNKGSAVIEGDKLSYLHLAREDSSEVGPYGISAEERSRTAQANADTGPSAAQDPAALAYRGHALQLADMLRAISENGTPLVDGYAARHPTEIILGIYESARLHREVTLS